MCPLSQYQSSCVVCVYERKIVIGVIHAHPLSKKKEEEDKDISYEELEAEYEKLSKYDIKVVIGDFDAKIGKEEIYV